MKNNTMPWHLEDYVLSRVVSKVQGIFQKSITDQLESDNRDFLTICTLFVVLCKKVMSRYKIWRNECQQIIFISGNALLNSMIDYFSECPEDCSIAIIDSWDNVFAIMKSYWIKNHDDWLTFSETTRSALIELGEAYTEKENLLDSDFLLWLNHSEEDL